MGLSNSKQGAVSGRSWTWRQGDEAIVKLMLPVYYNPATIVASEIAIAKKSWEVISFDRSIIYLEKLKSTSFMKAYATCKDWFCDVFYERLFDVHPLCKPMFKSAMSKGSFIHGLLSFLFTSLEDKRGFHQKLLQIAHSHCAKGVKAVEYGIVGECMFWALEHCLGPGDYPPTVHSAWIKIFSSMLRVIVPVAVAHELASNEAQRNRVFDHDSSFLYNYSEKTAVEVCPVLATSSSNKPDSNKQPKSAKNRKSSKGNIRAPEVVKDDNPPTIITTTSTNNNNNNNNNNGTPVTQTTTTTTSTKSPILNKNISQEELADIPKEVFAGINTESVKEYKQAKEERRKTLENQFIFEDSKEGNSVSVSQTGIEKPLYTSTTTTAASSTMATTTTSNGTAVTVGGGN